MTAPGRYPLRRRQTMTGFTTAVANAIVAGRASMRTIRKETNLHYCAFVLVTFLASHCEAG